MPDDYQEPVGDPGGAGDVCIDATQCQPGNICFNKFCVGSGDLRISLGFSADTDFDLHVRTPLGQEIWYANRTADGGYLDVDQCIQSCGVGNHVENVFFTGAPRGVYEVFVVNFDGRSAGDFNLEVAPQGLAVQSFTGFLTGPRGNRSQSFTFNF